MHAVSQISILAQYFTKTFHSNDVLIVSSAAVEVNSRSKGEVSRHTEIRIDDPGPGITAIMLRLRFYARELLK
jgi:hypothetical protein